MLKELRHRLLLAAAICLLILASPWVAAEGIHDHPVSVDWFGNHLKDAEVLIFDISPAQPMYEGQQISGVVNVDLFSYGGPEVPGAPEMEQRFALAPNSINCYRSCRFPFSRKSSSGTPSRKKESESMKTLILIY